jgi:hypothetical protein
MIITKKENMKALYNTIYLLGLFLLMGTNCLHAQKTYYNSLKEYKPSKEELATGWELFAEKDGLAIYHKTFDVNIKRNRSGYYSKLTRVSLLVFKLENNSTETMNVSWDFDLWFNNVCQSCDHMGKGSFYHRNVTLKPGETRYLDPRKEGTDGNNNNAIYMDDHGVKLTKFDIRNLQISKTQPK